MRKNICIIFITVLCLLVFTGCGSNKSQNTNQLKMKENYREIIGNDLTIETVENVYEEMGESLSIAKEDNGHQFQLGKHVKSYMMFLQTDIENAASDKDKFNLLSEIYSSLQTVIEQTSDYQLKLSKSDPSDKDYIIVTQLSDQAISLIDRQVTNDIKLYFDYK